MATKMTKRVWNFFTIAQWEEEEQWLNAMARNGWNLVRIDALVRYVFERGTAGEYIYKLDLPDGMERGMDEQQYCDFLKECDIDVVCHQKQWLFLRKKAADGPFDEKSDVVAKLKMTNKAYDYAVRTLSALLRVFAVLLGINIFALYLFNNPTICDCLQSVITGMGVGTIIALTAIWIPIMNKLRKKMNALIREITIKR